MRVLEDRTKPPPGKKAEVQSLPPPGKKAEVQTLARQTREGGKWNGRVSDNRVCRVILL